MSDAEKLQVRAIFDTSNQQAAADMRKRAILVLVEMKRGIGAWDEATLVEAMERIEKLSVHG